MGRFMVTMSQLADRWTHGRRLGLELNVSGHTILDRLGHTTSSKRNGSRFSSPKSTH